MQVLFLRVAWPENKGQDGHISGFLVRGKEGRYQMFPETFCAFTPENLCHFANWDTTLWCAVSSKSGFLKMWPPLQSGQVPNTNQDTSRKVAGVSSLHVLACVQVWKKPARGR